MAQIHVNLKMNRTGRTEVECAYTTQPYTEASDVAEFWHDLMKELTERGLNPTVKPGFMKDDEDDA